MMDEILLSLAAPHSLHGTSSSKRRGQTLESEKMGGVLKRTMAEENGGSNLRFWIQRQTITYANTDRLSRVDTNIPLVSRGYIWCSAHPSLYPNLVSILAFSVGKKTRTYVQ